MFKSVKFLEIIKILNFKDYEERNEINLDDWSPSVVKNDFENDTISEGEEPDDENTPAVVIENPPYPESLSDLDTHNNLDLDPYDINSVAPGNRSSARNSIQDDIDYSSQPWINPKFRKEKEHSQSCTTWPIRR